MSLGNDQQVPADIVSAGPADWLLLCPTTVGAGRMLTPDPEVQDHKQIHDPAHRSLATVYIQYTVDKQLNYTMYTLYTINRKKNISS